MMLHVILVGVGGFLGSMARFAVSRWIGDTRLPFSGTLLVNLAGSFGLGWIVASDWAPSALVFAGAGFLGSFTTFSTLKAESLRFISEKDWGKLAVYLGITYGGGLFLAWLGAMWGMRS